MSSTEQSFCNMCFVRIIFMNSPSVPKQTRRVLGQLKLKKSFTRRDRVARRLRWH